MSLPTSAALQRATPLPGARAAILTITPGLSPVTEAGSPHWPWRGGSGEARQPPAVAQRPGKLGVIQEIQQHVRRKPRKISVSYTAGASRRCCIGAGLLKTAAVTRPDRTHGPCKGTFGLYKTADLDKKCMPPVEALNSWPMAYKQFLWQGPRPQEPLTSPQTPVIPQAARA